MIVGDPENVDAQYRTEFSIKALTDAGIAVKSAQLGQKQGQGALLRLSKQEDQLPAKELVRKLLGDEVVDDLIEEGRYRRDVY